MLSYKFQSQELEDFEEGDNDFSDKGLKNNAKFLNDGE